MSDVLIRRDGLAGRITLNRPRALNALTAEMIRLIDAALRRWAEDDAVALVMIEGEGERAFCAGGDVTAIHRAAAAGDLDAPRRFWADEYAMNARISRYGKPVVSFLHGYVMGGGVGLGCHASHRVVDASSRVAMPECAIGLVPDVGGTLLLARAPGRLGEFLGLTGHRMGPGCAIFSGFADHFVPGTAWDALKAALAADGDADAVAATAAPRPEAELEAEMEDLNCHFAGARLGDIWRGLIGASDGFGARTRAEMAGSSPLAMACALELVHRVSPSGGIAAALELEYRYVWRSLEQGDVLEGIRALVIDKDRAPRWAHPGPEAVTAEEVARMLWPLEENALALEGQA